MRKSLDGESTYGGIAAISRCPSALGFNPSGDETMALSNSFRVCKKQSVCYGGDLTGGLGLLQFVTN